MPPFANNDYLIAFYDYQIQLGEVKVQNKTTNQFNPDIHLIADLEQICAISCTAFAQALDQKELYPLKSDADALSKDLSLALQFIETIEQKNPLPAEQEQQDWHKKIYKWASRKSAEYLYKQGGVLHTVQLRDTPFTFELSQKTKPWFLSCYETIQKYTTAFNDFQQEVLDSITIEISKTTGAIKYPSKGVALFTQSKKDSQCHGFMFDIQSQKNNCNFTYIPLRSEKTIQDLYPLLSQKKEEANIIVTDIEEYPFQATVMHVVAEHYLAFFKNQKTIQT